MTPRVSAHPLARTRRRSDDGRRELTVLSSRNALPGDFLQIIRQIEDGKIDTGSWITHRAALADVPGLFESWTKPETGVIKAMIEVP